MKALLRTAIGLILLLIGLLVFLDQATERAVEHAAEEALEVDAELANASLGLLSGSIGLESLAIDNPPGFAAEHFLFLSRAAVDLSWTALARERLVIPELAMDGVRMALERDDDGSNYEVLLRTLRGGGSPALEARDLKELVLRRVVVRDLRVSVESKVAGEAACATTLVVPEVVLRDLLGPDAGHPLAQQVSALVRGLLEATVRAGGEELPPELVADVVARLEEFPERVAVELAAE